MPMMTLLATLATLLRDETEDLSSNFSPVAFEPQPLTDLCAPDNNQNVLPLTIRPRAMLSNESTIAATAKFV